MKARVRITLKPGVLDPQGKAIAQSLASMGYDNVRDVRQGKYIEIDLNESDRERAKELVEDMCGTLLANPLIETYKVDLEG